MKEKQNLQKNKKQQTERKRKQPSMRGSKNSTTNREFSVITYVFLGLFICLMGYMVYFQAVKSEDFINSPYNKRQDSFAARIIRGEIRSADGKVLARTDRDEAGNETRYYPYGNLYAHVVGFASNGKSGLESSMNFNLLRSHSFILERMVNEIKGEKNVGDNVITTLDSRLQEAAYKRAWKLRRRHHRDGARDRKDPCYGFKAGFRSEYNFRKLGIFDSRGFGGIRIAESCNSGHVSARFYV